MEETFHWDEKMKKKKSNICENCIHWGSLTWMCVNPRGHRNHETSYPQNSCQYFESL
jgi:hypothetical protein